MASRTTALLITAAIAVLIVGALLPATAWAEDGDNGDGEGDGDGEVDGVYYIAVGDEKGWNLTVDYNSWASHESFNVGDVLRFKYSTDEPFPHNVVAVDQASFEACTVPSNALVLASGNDIVPLWNAGPYYFFSSLNGDCKAGMKLAINVAP